MDNVDVKAEVIRGHRYWLLGLLIVMYLFVGKMKSYMNKEKSYNQVMTIMTIKKQ